MNYWLLKENNNMNKAILILSFCLIYLSSFGIVKNSILHYSNTEINIESLTNVIYKTSYKVEILNKFEEDANELILYYSPQQKINTVSVVLSAPGFKTKKYRKKDFKDYAADGSNLSTDSRAIVMNIDENNFPYFIEVEYEKEIAGTMFLPDWDPQENNNQYIKEASIKIINNTTADLFFENYNMPQPTANGKTYHAVVKNIEPFDYESYSYNSIDYYPILEMKCSSFEFFDYQGSFESWQSFGAFQSQLHQQRNTLSQTELTAIKKEIPLKDTKLAQAKAIYDYMQNNSRYVSVQLGVGGWQPQETGFTHQKKYGDCKALSFYTQALLNQFDIPSYYTLINAGKYGFNKVNTKPNSNFNHVILTVPIKEDTIWLECTSQSNPFGYIGTFTSDRYALAIDGNNSKLIKTKAYGVEENISQSKYYINIKSADDITVEIDKTLSGIVLQESGLMNFESLTKIEQENRLADINAINNFNRTEYKVSPTSNEIVPKCELSITGNIGSGLSIKGTRIFFKLSDFFADQEVYFNEEERTKPIYLQYPFTKVDVVFITYPDNYNIEAPVKSINETTKYGEFSIDYAVIDDSNIMVTRKILFNKGTYQVSEFEPLKAFTKTIKKKDKAMVVFKVN